MGQSGSSAPKGERSCCQQSSQADKQKDTVVVDSEAFNSTVRAASAARQPPPRRRVSGGGAFSCRLAETPGPEVEVVDVEPQVATVRWSLGPKNVRTYHIYMVFLPSAGEAGDSAPEPVEVAFFEADGGCNSLVLPAGTLTRASGPYRAEVIAETGTAEKPHLSGAGVSAPFDTPAEAPGLVTELRLSAEPQEEEVCISWATPLDDGGSPVEDYEIMFREHDGEPMAPSLASSCSSDPSSSVPSRKSVQTQPIGLVTRCCSHAFGGLLPGSGPYVIEVRARNGVGLRGACAQLVTSTLVAAPSAPTGLTARLLQTWPSREGGEENWWARSEVNASDGDVDAVRLEFRAPLEDGGRSLQCYKVYASPCGPHAIVDEEQQLEARQLCTVSVDDAAAGGKFEAGGHCAVDVAVVPNCTYSFAVEAWNGHRASPLSTSQPSVFVPARVPKPPDPPRATLRDGSCVAELRWEVPLVGGGLPLLSFKIGVMGGRGDLGFSSEVTREVTVNVADAALAACYDDDDDDAVQNVVQAMDLLSQPQAGVATATPQKTAHHAPAKATRTLCFYQVDGLEADARYCFLLAASNLIGTGQWSSPSASVRTPVAAPAAPKNAVATVKPGVLDARGQQVVVVTISWDCGHSSPGSGAIKAYNVALYPTAKPGGVADASIREQVAAGKNGTQPGHRMVWTAELTHPGRYKAEIIAESTFGRRSAPVELSLEVCPETFPRKVAEPRMPRWAEEPLLFLGPAGAGAAPQPSSTLAQDFELDGTKWLQTMLLWLDGDTSASLSGGAVSSTACAANPAKAMSPVAAASVDVVCFYRRAGTDEAKISCLATSITASRLQAVLPAHVPMSLRLLVRADGSAPKRQRAQSEPLLLQMSDAGEQLKPLWEVWSRQAPDGQPPRWTELPEALQATIEAAWVEGQSKVSFELPHNGFETDQSASLAPGKYEIVFGDDSRVQHSVRRLNSLGIAQWSANARRSVRDERGEDAAAPPIPMEELCVICMEQRRTHAFMHADTGDGHLAVCGVCSEAYRAEANVAGAARPMRTCPMCRRSFTAVQRIYS